MTIHEAAPIPRELVTDVTRPYANLALATTYAIGYKQPMRLCRETSILALHSNILIHPECRLDHSGTFPSECKPCHVSVPLPHQVGGIGSRCLLAAATSWKPHPEHQLWLMVLLYRFRTRLETPALLRRPCRELRLPPRGNRLRKSLRCLSTCWSLALG